VAITDSEGHQLLTQQLLQLARQPPRLYIGRGPMCVLDELIYSHYSAPFELESAQQHSTTGTLWTPIGILLVIN
jgi:hypothetical protein